MAGAGYKLFNTGDVLTAAQVNTYLQEQVVMVFANAAARTTALSGVLAEGMVTYLKDTDALEIYSGAAWVGYGSGDITGITTGASSGLTGGVTSGTADLKLNTSAKGGLLVGTGSGTVSELAVGSNTQVLTADSTTATGLKWATAASGTTAAGTSVFLQTSQTISNSTDTFIGWDSESFDTDNYHDNATNNSRFTVPSGKAGKYLFTGTVEFQGNSTGTRTVAIAKNGATGGSRLAYFEQAPGTATQFNLTWSFVADLAVGDYLGVYVNQNSGGNLSVYGNASNTKASTASFMYLGA